MIAHKVLWVCKVESKAPTAEEQHNRKVSLPMPESLNRIAQMLYGAVLGSLSP